MLLRSGSTPTPPLWLLAFAMVWPTLGTWAYFVALAESPLARAAYAAAKVLQFGLPAVWFLVAAGRLPRGSWPRRGDLAAGLAAGLFLAGPPLAAAALGLLDAPALAGLPGLIRAKLDGFGITTAAGFVLLACFYSLLHSLLEEVYWRGFVFGALRQRGGFAPALVLSSLAFTSHHVLVIGELTGGYGPWTWLASLLIAIAGALWAGLYERTGSLWAPWLSHALADAALMALGYRLWAG